MKTNNTTGAPWGPRVRPHTMDQALEAAARAYHETLRERLAAIELWLEAEARAETAAQALERILGDILERLERHHPPIQPELELQPAVEATATRPPRPRPEPVDRTAPPMPPRPPRITRRPTRTHQGSPTAVARVYALFLDATPRGQVLRLREIRSRVRLPGQKHRAAVQGACCTLEREGVLERVGTGLYRWTGKKRETVTGRTLEPDRSARSVLLSARVEQEAAR